MVAALAPIAFDEALYWRYSRHLAAGFIDHPFMNPLMIHIGTRLFGDTPLGVRFMAVVLSLVATAAVWRAARLLLEDVRAAATATLLFNLTLVMSVASMVATSDEVVVTTTALLLWCLAELDRSGRAEWWLAAGVALGLGMCSKYTTVFFALSTLIWVTLTPERRRWIFSPWAWGGALLALAVFSPVLVWNAKHGWASFVYQSGRLTVAKGGLRTVGEFVGALLVLATPPIFVLGCIGLFTSTGERLCGSRRSLIVCFVAPIILYFLWHSLRERVQGNWPEPAAPAFAIAAAAAAWAPRLRPGWLDGLRVWSFRLAAPVGLGLAGVVYVSAATGYPQLGSHDPRVRALGVGWPQIGRRLEAIRMAQGARAILTTDYTLASWTRFYLPSPAPVEEVTERMRWANEPPPYLSVLSGPALYICKEPCGKLPKIKARFRTVTPLALLAQVADRRAGARYGVYRVQDRTSVPLFDPANVRGADHEE